MSGLYGPSGGGATAATFTARGTLYEQVYDIREYGATVGSANNATAIQSAINAAAAANTTPYAGGGAVFIPPGVWTTGQLTLKNRVALVGQDAASSILKSVAGATAAMIVNDTSGGTVLGTMQALRNLRLNGSGGGASQQGVSFDFSGARGTSEFNDVRWRIQSCHVENFTGDGVTIAGRGSGIMSDCTIWLCDGNGLLISGGIDSHYLAVDVGSCGLDGIQLNGASDNHLTGCKAWFSGRISTANGTGNGIRVWNGCSGTWIDNCGGQDNARSGLALGVGTGGTGTHRTLVRNFSADSNDTAGAGVGGIDIDNVGITYVDGLSWDRAANTNHQQAALNITSNAGAGVTTDIEFYGMSGGLGSLGALATGSSTTVSGNDIKVGRRGWINASPAAAATYTPNPYTGSKFNVTMPAGNITVANPASQHIGQEMEFVFTQDGTGGRTVAWGASYKMNWTPTTTASKKNTIIFRFDGTSWIQIGGVVGI